MAEVHHFTYGAVNPIAAYLLAFVGSFFGLLCTGRARRAHTRGRRTRWLVIAAFSIGGGAVWLMHYAAMLGFDVPAGAVRYDAGLTLASLVLAVVPVGAGLMVVGHGRRSAARIVTAGTLTGLGLLAMHYTGMRGMHLAGTIGYRPALVVASALIAVVSATVALWCTVSVKGWWPVTGAAALMAAAVCGMHYLGMAAMQVRLAPLPTGVSGLRPLMLIVPITLVTTAITVALAMSALQAMTEEEFTDGAAMPRRGVHAEPWSLRQASIPSVRRTPGPRPSPRPVPRRVPTTAKAPATKAPAAEHVA